MIIGVGTAGWCEECGKYKESTRERVVPCFDECRCDMDMALCTPCAADRAKELEKIEREREREGR